MRNTLKLKKKKCNRASPQKSPTSILNVKQTQSKQKKTTQQMVNSKANPRMLKKKKKKKNPNIHCKSLNQKPQITNQISLKRTQIQKTSIEQRSQHYNTSQQTDRASPHQRSVSQHNSISSPEHIALGFRHRRLLTGLDRRSPIGHVAHHSACFVARHCACSGAPSTSTSRYFITSLFFFFFSL